MSNSKQKQHQWYSNSGWVNNSKRYSKNKKYNTQMLNRKFKLKDEKMQAKQEGKQRKQQKQQSRLFRIKETLWITIAYYAAVYSKKLMYYIRFNRKENK